MKLIGTVQGHGTLRIVGGNASHAEYSISCWSNGDEEPIAVGHLAAGLREMIEAEAGRRAILALSDGREFEITVSRRGAGTAWGELEVRSPVALRHSAEVLPFPIERRRDGSNS